MLLVQGPAPDGQGTRVLRQREGRLEIGCIRPVVSGQALTGELVRLSPRPELPALFDVKVEVAAPGARPPDAGEATAPPSEARTAQRTHAGPARVSTPHFREGWDAIWGKKTVADRRMLN